MWSSRSISSERVAIYQKISIQSVDWKRAITKNIYVNVIATIMINYMLHDTKHNDQFTHLTPDVHRHLRLMLRLLPIPVTTSILSKTLERPIAFPANFSLSKNDFNAASVCCISFGFAAIFSVNIWLQSCRNRTFVNTYVCGRLVEWYDITWWINLHFMFKFHKI